MDLNTLFNEFIDSINLEIETRKEKAKYRPLLIKDGEKAAGDPNGTIYRFNEFSYNVIPDSPVEVFIINGKPGKVNKNIMPRLLESMMMFYPCIFPGKIYRN